MRKQNAYNPLLSRILGVLCASTVVSSCDDDVNLGKLDALIEVVEVVDFGDVQVGITAKHELKLKNAGSGAVQISSIKTSEGFSGSVHQFVVPMDPFTLRPNEETTLTITYQPFQESEEPNEVSFTLETAPEDAEVTVKLRGRGVRSGLIVDPNPIDFGTVLVGSTRDLQVTLTNALSSPVELFQVGLTQGSGDGRFELIEAPAGMLNAAGSLLPSGQTLEAGQSTTVTFRYTPGEIASEREDRGRWVVSNCEFSLCEQTIPLIGRNTDSALECQPSAVDFGAVNPGRSRTLPVVCTNVASDPITLTNWSLESSDSEYSAVSFDASVAELAPGASATIDVTFSPTQMTFDNSLMPQGTLLVEGISAGSAISPIRIPLTGVAGGPTIAVLPVRIQFGQTAINTSNTKRMLIQNLGFDDLVIDGVQVNDTDIFGTDIITPLTVAVGTSTIVHVTFTPDTETQYSDALIISSNDTATPMLTVPLDGEGLDLPPCAYTITPTSLSFGVVPLTQMQTQGVQIRNEGMNDCLVNDIEMFDNSASNPFSLVNGGQTGIFIPPGGTHDIPVEFAPTTPGGHNNTLTFYISDPRASNPTVDVFGVGEPLTQITCPTPVITPSGTAVSLSVNASALGANITGYDWQVVGGPMGGIGTPGQWNPAPPTAQTETFLPIIVGVYSIHVTAFDSNGGSAGCDTQVTAEGSGLRVAMTWNGSGDVDLHLNNSTTLPWFSSPNDCYYSNDTPIWDGASPIATGPNPELDIDNTSGLGPENISLDGITLGQTYTIGVHNYSSAAGRTVEIQVFCGQVTIPTQTFVSAPLNGTSSGNCSANDFWTVATVVFNTPSTCTITPVNTVTPSQDRCTAY